MTLGLNRDTLRLQAALRRSISEAGVALLVVSWEMEVLYSSEAARALCAFWSPKKKRASTADPGAEFRLPPEIEGECLRLKLEVGDASAAAQPEAPRVESRIFPEEQGSVSARIRMVFPETGELGEPHFEIRLHRVPEVFRFADSTTGATLPNRLSSAEAEVVVRVCQGLSNKEVATQLGKSIETIKKQLTSAYGKLRISGRNRLIALFGRPPPAK